MELGLARKLGKDWANNPKNKFIVTECGFSNNTFAGRQNVKHVPVDTRMTTTGAKLMVQELKPKELVICQVCPCKMLFLYCVFRRFYIHIRN
jgi:hypothetical protein